MRGLGLVAVLFCVALVLGIVTMPLPRTLFYWGNICICAGQSETGKKPSKGKLLSPPVPRKCSASENHFYLGSTFIGLLSQDQRGSSIKATTTSIVVTWPPIKRSNMTGWMAATSAGEEKKKNNSVIFINQGILYGPGFPGDPAGKWLHSKLAGLTQPYVYLDFWKVSLHSMSPHFHHIVIQTPQHLIHNSDDRLCDFDGCDRPDLQPISVKGWFWTGSNKKIAPTNKINDG